MKRIIVSAVLIGLFLSVNVWAQKAQRARVVKTPTPNVETSTNSGDNSVPNETSRPKPTLHGASNAPNTTTSRPLPVLQGQATPTPTTPGGAKNDEPVEDDGGVIKVETNLVTIPVSVLDRDGHFISGLQKKDFKIFEDGTEQKVEYFATTETPFTVALVLDMSNSTRFKIDEIRAAAITFVNQLRPQDRVMVVSFDDNTHVLAEPTSDRNALRRAIQSANIGSGTALYDTIDFVINRRFNQIQGRKAIVLFTDGVDTTSHKAKYQTNMQDAEELDALIYPILYDTYSDMQGRSGGGGGIGFPRRGGGKWTTIIDILATGGNVPIRGGSSGGGAGSSRSEYERGKRYMNDLANATGGRLFNADTTRNLDFAFSNIAEELRRQYSLGYYPETEGKIGQRKQIKVRVQRPNVAVKARDTYIVGENEATAGKKLPNKFAGK